MCAVRNQIIGEALALDRGFALIPDHNGIIAGADFLLHPDQMISLDGKHLMMHCKDFLQIAVADFNGDFLIVGGCIGADTGDHAGRHRTNTGVGHAGMIKLRNDGFHAGAVVCTDAAAVVCGAVVPVWGSAVFCA